MLHVGLVVALFVSFSKKLDIPDSVMPMVPVDLVTVGDENNVKPTVKPDVIPPDVEEQQPAQPPDVAPPKIDVAPDTKPDVKPKPEKKTDAEKFDINDIEKLLAKKKPANAQIAARTVQGVGAGTAMTADLQTVLASQIYRCWSPPAGAINAAALIVTYDIYLDRGGNVTGEPKLLSAGAPFNTPRDAANQAAYRAIKACQPYKLPGNRYAEWRHFSFNFNPHDVVGP